MTTSIVVGSNSDIGTCICANLKEVGHRIFGVGSKQGSVNPDVVDDYFSCDLSKQDDCESLIKALHEKGENFDNLIYSAGYYLAKPLRTTSFIDFETSFGLNAIAPAFLGARFSRLKKEMQESQSIVLIGSIAGVLTEGGLGAYSASKSGLDHLTRSLARELGSKKTRVNCIHPGWIESKRSDAILARMSDQQKRTIFEKNLLGVGKPSDVASCTRFLCSDESSWITGQSILVDGGWSVMS